MVYSNYEREWTWLHCKPEFIIRCLLFNFISYHFIIFFPLDCSMIYLLDLAETSKSFTRQSKLDVRKRLVILWTARVFINWSVSSILAKYCKIDILIFQNNTISINSTKFVLHKQLGYRELLNKIHPIVFWLFFKIHYNLL